jgi:hypothetical protein
VRDLSAAIPVATQVGALLGRGPVLLHRLPARARQTRIQAEVMSLGSRILQVHRGERRDALDDSRRSLIAGTNKFGTAPSRQFRPAWIQAGHRVSRGEAGRLG